MYGVHPAIQVLARAVDALPEKYGDRIRGPMGFFKMFFSGLPRLEDHNSGQDWALRSAAMLSKFEGKAEEFEAADEMANWDQMCCGLEEMMEQCKPVVEQICTLYLNESSKSTQSQSDECSVRENGWRTVNFILLVLRSLQNLEYTTHLTPLLEKQFAFISEKLTLFKTIVLNALHLPNDPAVGSEQLIRHTNTWANRICNLVCFYWTAERLDDNLAMTSEVMLSDLMQKYMPRSVDVTTVYLNVLLEFRYIEWHSGFLVRDYVNYLLEPFVSSDVEGLREGLVFLLSFVLTLGTKTPYYKVWGEREPILVEIYDIIRTHGLPIICISQSATNMANFLHSIDMVKIKVRDVYAFTPLSPRFKYPHANGMPLLDSLLTKLQDTIHGNVDFIPSIKHHIELVEEELALLRSFVQVKLDRKEEHKELLDVWTQMVNVAYFAAYVADYCSTSTLLVWYGILCLPTLVEETNLVKSKAKVLANDAFTFIPRSVSSSPIWLFIGFEQEVNMIVKHLTDPREKLGIISILGMAGQGKTSLAKRIYNDPSIHYHYFKKVWCSVTNCNPQILLVNIARDLGCNIDVNLEIKYLTRLISHNLRGKRYFIIFDDIWDINLWKVLRSSFPDDGNGSVILLTSRNLTMVFRDEQYSIPFELPFFTDKQSWDLISATVFDCDGYLPDLVGIGQKIAGSCKGLPLAVALIASVLARKKKVYELWEEVATNFRSHLATEGFTDIVGLSYERLPAFLKPCFLYFGSFPRGQSISVKKLKLLWIADRLVEEESWTHLACNSLDSLGFSIFDALVSHSLVLSVGSRAGSRSMGGVKTCKVHELLYDMCLDKAVQENFLHLVDGNTIVGECYSNPQKCEFQFHRRLCIHQIDSLTPPKSVCTRNQLSSSLVHCIIWSGFRSDLRQNLSFFLGRFKDLTILNLEDLYLPAFPRVILCNIHLRYLVLRGLIEKIPPSITDLCNLETIIIKRASLSSVALPDSFWAMKSLRYIHIDRIALPPRNDEPYTAAPCQIRVLSGIILEYGLKGKEFMRRLTKLRKLKCYCNGVLDPVWFECLEELESLHVRNGYGGSSLILPSQSLSGFHFPKSLKKLVLEECGLPWSVMSTIGSLPCLKVLKLRKWACVGLTWHLGDGRFGALRYLELSDLDVEQIDESACNHPPFLSLAKLLLIRCLGLEDLPSCFTHIYWLLSIDVSGSSIAPESVRKNMEKNRWGAAYGLED